MSKQKWRLFWPYMRLERSGLIGFYLLVVFHCVATLGSCLRSGRLSIVPIYDDVEYLVDGLNRIARFEQDGIVGLIRSFVVQPPHAPYSTLIAVMGFVLTPYSMVGAYALDCIWLPIILVLINRVLRDLPILSRVGVLTASLAVPLFGVVISSFRPDPSWGLITGIVAVLLATLDINNARLRTCFGMGLLVGATALSKPTGMPAGVVVMATGYVGAVVTSAFIRPTSMRHLIIKTSALLLGVLIPLVPYLAVAWGDLWLYISSVMGKDSSVWRTSGSALFQVTYYLRPEVSGLLIGWILIGGPVALIIASCIATNLRYRYFAGPLCSVCAVVIVAYAIPTISPVKSGFIGCLFYGAVTAATLWAIGQAISILALPSPLVLLAGLALFVIAWTPSSKFDRVDGPAYAAMNAANMAIAPELLNVISNARAGSALLQIYSPSPGPILSGTQEYQIRLSGRSAIVLGDYTESDWSALLHKAELADVVIASQQGALGQGGGFSYPTIQYQDKLIAALDDDKTWRRLKTFTDLNGFQTVVFTKEPKPDSVRVSFGDGFRDFEGPYPGMGLPVVRWLTADKAALHITLDDGAIAPSTFDLQCQSISPVKVTVEDGAGKVISMQAVDQRIGSGDFGRVRIPWSREHRTDSFKVIVDSQQSIGAKDWPGSLLCDNHLIRVD